MRRPVATIVTLVALLTQLGLGVSASLGLVMCVGNDHAAIELAADDCCASHGPPAPAAAVALERDCCSDIPLYEAMRVVADVPRGSVHDGPGLAVLPAVAALPDVGRTPPAAVVVTASPPSSLDRRSTVLRV
jgi:hypothetical protein